MSMVASHLVWLFRTRGIRQRAKESNQTFDESEEGAQWQSEGLDLEKRMRGIFTRTNPQVSSTNNSTGTADTYGTFETHASSVPKTVPNATA